MKTLKFRKCIIITFTVLVSLILGGKYAKASNVENSNYSVTKYESYLQNYNEVTAVNSGVPKSEVKFAVSNSKTVLKKFQKLSKSNQKRFVMSLSNPQKNGVRLIPLSKTRNTSGNFSTNSFFDPLDIIFGPSKTVYASRIKYKSVSQNVGMMNFKITVVKIHFGVRYQVKGKKVKKTVSSHNYVVYNYNPLLHVNKAANYRHVTSKNKAYTHAVWRLKLGPLKGYSFQYGNLFGTLEGNYKGHIAYRHFWQEILR